MGLNLDMFKYVGSGWEVPDDGVFDLKNEERHTYVVMTDKRMTMNSERSRISYINMQARILDNRESVCYLVDAYRLQPYNKEWAVTVDGYRIKHKQIRRMSISSFCEMVLDIQP